MEQPQQNPAPDDPHRADYSRYSVRPSAFSRGSRALLIGGLMAVIGLPLVGEMAVDLLTRGRWRGYESFRAWTLHRDVGQFERDVNRTSLVGRFVRQEWIVAGGPHAIATTDRAVSGRDGWAFLQFEIDVLSSPGHNNFALPGGQDVMDQVVAMSQWMEQRGVHLVFANVPMKASVYPEFVNALAGASADPLSTDAADRGPRLPPGRQQWLDELSRRGVDVVDLVPPFMAAKADDDVAGPLYLPGDSHWSPRGCELAAVVLAERLRDRIAPDPSLRLTIEKREMATPADMDNVRDISLDDGLPDFSAISTHAVYQDGRIAEFNDDSPIALVGDSNCLYYAGSGANLGHHIALRLGQGVQTFAAHGGAINVARRHLAANAPALAAKKIVIWIPAERFLHHSEKWESPQSIARSVEKP